MRSRSLSCAAVALALVLLAGPVPGGPLEDAEARLAGGDPAGALAILRQAAMTGEGAALVALGQVYEAGHPAAPGRAAVPDPHTAWSLYAEAGLRGWLPGEVRKAHLSVFGGPGVADPPYGHALCLWVLAQPGGDTVANRADCERIAAAVSPEDRAAGEELARSW